MSKLLALALAVAAGTGCYASPGVSVYGSTSYGSYANPYYTPPEVAEEELYYEPRAGYVHINGRHTYTNGQWAWTPGYYEAERPGYVYIQGYWYNGSYVGGYWTPQRAGYTYTGGYWDRRGRGHVWVNGTWEPERRDGVYVQGRWSNHNGVRTYTRGGWQPRRDRGPVIRDHRHRR